MKITTGQFNDSYFPIMDGVGLTVHNYALWLNEKYGESLVITPRVKDYEDNVPYKVYRFKSMSLLGMKPYRVGLPLLDVEFNKEIKKVGFDLIHMHCPFISGQIALKLAKKLDVPLVATFHTKYRDDFIKLLKNDRLVDFLVNFTLHFYNSADFVWVPNKASGQTLQEYGFKGTYEVMPNGTDMAIPGKSKMICYRNKGLEMIKTVSGEFVMLFVGQHKWEKNVRLIIESLKIVKDSGHSFKMVFVGEGYAVTEMKKFVSKYDLLDYVVFLGVITDRDLLQCIFAASDLFVFPSIYDNSPLVIQEAAAFDIPSVLVRNSSSAEGIKDGVNGFLVENEAAHLSMKIIRLMSQRQAIKIAGEGARKSIYHTWESIVDDVYLRYIDIIKAHKPHLAHIAVI
jgi:1,2-diacylglycerol 3-alpha-glucosyltransferase